MLALVMAMAAMSIVPAATPAYACPDPENPCDPQPINIDPKDVAGYVYCLVKSC
jgi:hypothetical protein